MGCYVDALLSYPDAGFRYTEFCHLLADERAELHEMAGRLGVPRRFFQDHPVRWHYDLPAHVRAEAVRHGAHEVSRTAVAELLRTRRRARDERLREEPGSAPKARRAATPAGGRIAPKARESHGHG